MSEQEPQTSDGQTLVLVLHPALIDPLKEWLAQRNVRLVLFEKATDERLATYVVTPAQWPT